MPDRVEILRVGLDPSGVESGVRRARRAYSDLARGAQGVAAGSDSASASLRRVAGESDRTQQAVQRLGRETGTAAAGVRRLQSALAALGIGLGVREIANYADTWRLIEGRLKLVTGSTAQLLGVQDSLFRIAQETRTEYQAVAELYARVARNAEQLGRSQAELLDFTEAVQKAIQLSGATAQEASAGVIQLSQALASGQLRGEEFRAVSEQMPGIMLAMQQALGKTAGELREMAFAGELTADIVVQAMLDMKDSIDRDFQSVPRTIGQAFVVLRNEIQRFIGEADRANGTSAALSAGIVALSRHIDGLVTATTALAVLYAGRWLRAKSAAIAATVAHTRAQIAGEVATRAAAAAAGTQAAALTLSTRAMATASVAARGLWAAIGGPVGATLLGLFAVYEAIQRIGAASRESAEEARRGVQEFTASLQDMEAAALRSERAALEFQLSQIQRMRDALPATVSIATGSFLGGGRASMRNPALDGLETQADTVQQKLAAIDAALAAIFAPRQRSADITQDLRESAEGLVRAAQQALNLTRLEGDARERLAVEQRAVNRLIEAERNLTGEALEHMRSAIETERRLGLEAIDVAAAMERQAEAAKRTAEAWADMARYAPQIAQAFTIADRIAEMGREREAARAARIERGEAMGMVLTPVRLPGRATGGQVRDAGSARQAIAEGVRGLIDLGDAAGALGDNARRALSGVTGLVSSIGSFGSASGALGRLGAGFGIAGAAAGIVASLFDDSAERERNRILAENNRALERLRQSFETFGARDDLVRGIGVIDSIQAAGNVFEQMAALGPHIGFLSQLADQFGINLKNNTLVGLQQLEDALRMAADRAFRFADTLAGAQARQDALNEIFDRTRPEDQLAAQYDLLSRFAPDVLRAFGGANLNVETAAGRSALEQALRDAITAYATGTLDPALLGQFKSGQEFVDLLLGTDRALDAFTEGLLDATSAVTDIPRAVNLALFRARVTESAVQQVTGGSPPLGGSGNPAPGDPTRPGARPPLEGGAAGPPRPQPRAEGAPVYHLHIGTLTTQARSGEELLRELESAAKDAANRGRRVLLPSVRTAGI